MKPKIIFIVPSITNSHYKNRILEFVEKGYDVEVYGYERTNHSKNRDLTYKYHIIGNIEDENYINRINLYRRNFVEIGKKHCGEKAIFYLCGLDIAIFFTLINPKATYIYEECDLVHTYTKLKHIFEIIDKKIIKRSLLTVVTSEGFLNYHFGANRPDNVCLIENKLNPEILNCKLLEKTKQSKESLSIGFVGIPRFVSVYNFIDVFCKNYQQHSFHVFGGPITEQFQSLTQYSNCHFHGFFKNPIDLPSIYSQLDLVLSTYDIAFDNVRYAEPNKIYESIYFETPIIVSESCFLGNKVKKLNIGFTVNALDEIAVKKLIDSLTFEIVNDKIESIKQLGKEYAINNNEKFFQLLNERYKQL